MIELYCDDVLHRLDKLNLEGRKYNLIITSPPYNLNKEYESNNDLASYLNWQREVIHACHDLLEDTGSICWQVGHYIKGVGKSKSVHPLDLELYPIFRELGYSLKNRIVWHFGHGLHDKYRFSGRHETILWFTKSNEYTFNLDPVRVPQKYPSKKHFKGPNKGKLSGNPKGKNPSDVWDIPNVKANHVEKTDHPCQFPIGLVERLVLALTNEGDNVLDPFIGSGSTAVACIKNNRHCTGIDKHKSYLNIATDRFRMLEEGKLKIRPVSKPIYNKSK